MTRHWNSRLIAAAILYWCAASVVGPVVAAQEVPWERFAIDDSLRGADGVRLADANGDGRVDITTGWEESGVARVYLHPGTDGVRRVWPACTIGNTRSVEDAVWVDFNRDGALDVLCSCEGNERSLRLFLADPRDPEGSQGDLSMLNADRWTGQEITAAKNVTRWMFAIPVPDAGKPDHVIVGSKSPRGMVGMLTPGVTDRVAGATLRPLSEAGWIMSLVSLDVDRDGDHDVVFSDRKGEQSGVHWLENPGAADRPWNKHLIGGAGREVMFLQMVPGRAAHAARELVVAVKPDSILWFREGSDSRDPWQLIETIAVGPPERVGRAKGVAVGDVTGDGVLDLLYSCEGAVDTRSGVVLLTRGAADDWTLNDVSGPEGIKFDLLELVDLDDDGDLDVLTCEERHEGRGLGVIWYANPLHRD